MYIRTPEYAYTLFLRDLAGFRHCPLHGASCYFAAAYCTPLMATAIYIYIYMCKVYNCIYRYMFMYSIGIY